MKLSLWFKQIIIRVEFLDATIKIYTIIVLRLNIFKVCRDVVAHDEVVEHAQNTFA